MIWDSSLSKILVITDSIDVQDSSGSKANVAFIKSLVISGFQVSVFHLTGRDIALENSQTRNIKELQWTSLFFLSRFQRLFQRYLKIDLSKFLENRFGFSFTFFNDVNSVKKEFEKIDFSQISLVITLSKGESFRPHKSLLSFPELYSKWLAYVHDPYPFQNYPEPYKFIPKGATQKDNFFKQVAAKCRFAGFPSRYLADHMAAVYGDFLNKQVIIPHQYDSSFKIGELPSFFNKDVFNLVHTGNLIGGRSPEGLLMGFELFLKTNPDAKGKVYLHLIGPSGNYDELFAEFLKIEEFLPRASVTYSEALALQNEASVNLIIEASETDFSPFLPAKMAHAVYANKPIFALSPVKSEVRRLLGSYHKWQSKANDVTHISKILTSLFESWKANSKQDLKLNRPDLQTYFSSTYLAQRISNCIEDVA
tara:strand:- start:1853 stop:3121 length:1269 start_codon:yes stop_codon:yes gene_type:complete